MNRKRIVESFESFNKENLDYLILHKKTYIKKKEYDLKADETLLKIKEYDISKFKYVEKSYGIFIYPDDNFINLAKMINNEVDSNLFFYINVSKSKLNQIDFTEGVPDFLRGLSIGYKLYKMVIKKVGYVTSDRYSSEMAYNLWYNLLQDQDLYCFTSNIISGLIHKEISDDELYRIIVDVKSVASAIEYDSELLSKIKKNENENKNR